MATEAFTFGTPATTDANDGTTLYIMAVRWTSTVDGSWTGVRWRVPDSLGGNNHYVLAYQAGDSDTPRQSKAISPTPGGEQSFTFDSPVAITAGTEYIACVLTNHYVFTGSYPLPHTDGHLTADQFLLKVTDPDEARIPDTPTGLNFHVSPVVAFPDPDDQGTLTAVASAATFTAAAAATAAATLTGTATAATFDATAAATAGAALAGTAAAATLTVAGAAAASAILSATAAAATIAVAASTGANTVVPRPNTGTVTRPDTGTIHRPTRIYP